MKLIGFFLRAVFWIVLILLVIVPTLWYFYPTSPLFEAFYQWRIDNYLDRMTPEVQNSIASITVVDKIEVEESERFIAGLCDSEGNLYFSALPLIFQPSTIWHESAHAYHFQLDRERSDFSYRWTNIKGGVLTAYGQTGFREDVADWVREIYKDLDGDSTVLDRYWTQHNAVPYRQKLQLLREYKFISEEDCQKIIETHPALGRVFNLTIKEPYSILCNSIAR